MTDLVFRATIDAIECNPLGPRGRFLDWIVRTTVLEVIEGSFEGGQFAFRVHSPARAGLVVGISCTVTARWVGEGYTVDENQWHGAPR